MAGFGAEDRSGESAELAGQVAAVAPDLERRQFRFLGFDGPAWIQLLAALALANGWRLVSFDQDFQRFKGLHWLQPA